MKAKKSLGQHFLTSTKALSQIVDAGDIQPDDVVVEIGPGKGVLTQQLIARASKVIAIEKDAELIPLLEERFADAITQKKLQILELDVLKFDPRTLPLGPYKLIANIPYYITGAIIEQFLNASNQPSRMVLLMQREVAERIVARDGKGSILSIAIASYGEAHIVGRVPPGAFVPPPTVESAIICIESISRSFFLGCDEAEFFSVVKAVFGKKRKQIGGSLTQYIGNKEVARAVLEESGINTMTRPETMTLADWKKLTQMITKIKNSVQLDS